jgi:thymidylate synthase
MMLITIYWKKPDGRCDDDMSKADLIFKESCLDILENGYDQTGEDVRPRWEDGTPAYTIKRFGLVNRYDLSEEFPILTLRSINFKAAVDEILWIWQKKSNKISELNSRIWDSWADEQGTIGKAYGYQMAQKHHYPEGDFDQVDKVLYDLNHNPTSRRIMTNIYNHADLHEMQLYPCAYGLTFNVTGKKLNVLLNQRSQDMLVANGWNVTQYAVLQHMIAQVSGLTAGELVHVIADAHIYDRHVPIVRDLLKRDVYPAPRLVIDPSVKDFYAFTIDSFSLENYRHGEKVSGIPVAV